MHNFKSFIRRCPDGVGYNEELKAMFGKEAKRYLKQLSKSLNLSDYIISWNKSGIAVSGDVSVKGMLNSTTGIYIVISHPSYNGIMFRKIKDLNDHHGEHNNWFNPEHFEEYGDLSRYIKRRLGEDTTEEY